MCLRFLAYLLLFEKRLVYRLQNSRFRTFSEGAKRRKRDPRIWSARALLASLTIPPRRFYTRSSPFVRIWSVARVRKKYDCFAVYLVYCAHLSDPRLSIYQ